MTPRIKSFIAGFLALATAFGSAEVAGILDLLSKQNTTIAIAVAIGLPLLAALVHFATAVQADLDDDGLINGSTRGTKLKAILIPALCLLCLGGLPSCSGIMSGISGVPPEPVAVKREGGSPVNVVKRDLILAETGPPATVYGLYDVGQVARLTGKVVDSGK